MKKHNEFCSLVREIYKTNEFIPLHSPHFNGNERAYVNDAISSTFVSSVGEFVNSFERGVADYVLSPNSVAVVNGTSGLQVAQRLLGVKLGDEVITQALTFVATVNSISYNGARPIFLDVDIDTMGLSPEALELFLSENSELREDGTYNKFTNRKIAAVMPMHTFGFLCRIEEIVKISSRYGIPVVEDAAEAFGSFGDMISAGMYGDIGVFSFNGNKIITSGGGGILVSKSEILLKEAKHLTTTAKVPHPWEYDHDKMGYNFRMPNLNAALALGQLESVKNKISSKVKIFKEYKAGSTEMKLSMVNPPSETTTHWNHWLFSLFLEDKTERDLFLETTNHNGIMTRPIWRLASELPMYSECQKDDLKNSKYLVDRVVNIPSSSKI